ncbi:secretion system protein E [Neisseria chenwenguii]|uniref:Secretion system protein E n=1 Tax=Neisseria chenwenguii TaxID=1853278 RepID=A0A220S1V3_9NEIS|nr:ATPase, T2SS/T4P/T4SS family [Neisseria chenwenguii]ASK27165.1 secretion system protein E [Neisseria chenwenguii]
MSYIQSDATVRNLLHKTGLDVYLNTEGVTEVIINRANEVFLETSAGFQRIEDERLSLPVLQQLSVALCTYNSKHINMENPIHSVTLPDGERGHIMIPPSCEDKTIVYAFRKPSKTRFSLDDYIDSGRIAGFKDVATYASFSDGLNRTEIDGSRFRDTADKMKLPHDVPLADWQYEMLHHKANRDMNAFFELAVKHKLNICMVGGTGSGKTTFTKAIADMVPSETRIITLEDTHELDLPNHSNHAHLFYKGHITAKTLIAACMRLKPDRVFLTELRGDEAWDYLSLLNTGHPGGLTSVHANDARSVHYRIAQLAKESATGQTMDYDYILNSVKSTIDIVAFFDKTYMTELYYDPVEKFYAMRGRL